MFHRFIAVLLIAVSLFLHAAPVVMAAKGGAPAPIDLGTAKVGDVIAPPQIFPTGTRVILDANETGIAGVRNDSIPSVLVVNTSPATGTPDPNAGLWKLPDFDKFFADNPYLSQLICMTPGFISDLLNIAAGIFGVLSPFLGILGVFVSDPSNTITNIQQLVTMTQQLKSQFEQCKNQKRINSVLGTNAPPVELARFMAHVLGRYGETSFPAYVRSYNPQWFGGIGADGISLNSPEGILNAGLLGLRTAELFTGVIGEITGDAGLKQVAQNIADFSAKAESLISLVFATINIFTDVFTNRDSRGNPVSKARRMSALVIAVTGEFETDDASCAGSQDPMVSSDCFKKFRTKAEREEGFARAAEMRAKINQEKGNVDQENSGKTSKYKDEKLSASSVDSGAIHPDVMYNYIKCKLTGECHPGTRRECETDTQSYRLQAAKSCALKCAATSLNYVNNNTIKVQQLVTGNAQAPCVVAGRSLPAQFCPTLTQVVANSGSVRGDIQSLVAIEFYGLAGDLAMGEVTALCAACDGIRALQGAPTECK
jgi:hypothetical protein